MIIQYPFLSCIILFSLQSLLSDIYGPALCVYLSSIYFSILPSNVIIFLLRADKWNSAVWPGSRNRDQIYPPASSKWKTRQNATMSQWFWDIGHKTMSDHDPWTKETNTVKPLCLGAAGRVLWPQQRNGDLRGPCASLSGGEDWGEMGWAARGFPADGQRAESAMVGLSFGKLQRVHWRRQAQNTLSVLQAQVACRFSKAWWQD